MSTPHPDKAFVGAMPKLYETLLVPLIFEPYAADLARGWPPEPRRGYSRSRPARAW